MKKKVYKTPTDRYRFGGTMGKVEKIVVTKLGGPTKTLAFLVSFYLKYKYLADEEEQKIKQQLKRL